ncbi:MAG: transcriptional regulator [Candidatus Saccharimonadales bacterium]
MIEQLFGSKTRVKLLQLFYSNPNRSFYVREITRKIDEQINSVRRELANLLSIGIISSDTNNNRLYYEVVQDYEYYPPLAAIFGAGISPSVTAPSATAEKQTLKALGHVELAILTGRITRDDRSGIDLLLVGDLNQSQVTKYVAELEAKEGAELRYTVMNSDEFSYRREVNDRFIGQVLASKMQVLVDSNYVVTNKPTKKKTDKKVEE